MIPPANTTFTGALVLKSSSSSSHWQPIALFDKIGAASDYAELCDANAQGARYAAAEVSCAAQDVVPIEGELPLFRRKFSRDEIKAGPRPKATPSTREALEPGKKLRSA